MMELADEVKGQPEVLEEFARAHLPRAPPGSVLVGAGDSYAAALAGFYASKGRCIALDPYSLASDPEVARGVEVFLVSVSGKTASNVMAAKKVRGIAHEITVLTADPRSQLARIADSVVCLPMTYVPKTPGMLSFSLSLLAVMKIAGGSVSCDFRRALRAADRDRMKMGLGRGTTYFLGNALAQPATVYAAAKMYELLGARAHAELLEEFSHLELFSLTKADAVNIFSCFDPSGMAKKLAGALHAQGYEVCLIPARGASDADMLFHAVFVAQLSALKQAGEAGLRRPRFLGSGGRLRVSDVMIY